MERYENAYVYGIWFKDQLLYVGSSCCPLYKRKYHHKHRTTCLCEQSLNIHYWIAENVPDMWDNVELRMEEIAKVPCKDKQELRRAEGEHIRRLNPSCNKLIAGRTMKEWYEVNREKVLEGRKNYREANKAKIAEQAKAYYEANKEKRAEQGKAYYEANKEKLSAYQKAYYEANKEKRAEQVKAYCEANKEKINAYLRARYEANKEKINAYKKAWREAQKLKNKTLP